MTAKHMLGVALTMLLSLSSFSCASRVDAFNREAESAWAPLARDMGINDWNASLEVVVPETGDKADEGQIIDVLVMNRSNKSIWFPLGYGAKAFLYSREGESWAELPNAVTYVGREDTLVPRTSPSSNWAAQVSLHPTIPPVNGGAILRIIAVGRIVSQGAVTDQAVGGYADLHLSP